MLSMLMVWVVLSSYLSASPGGAMDESGEKDVKREHSDSDVLDPSSLEDLSDTSRTFPTLGRQMPLHYSGRGNVKREADEIKQEEEVMRSTDIQPLAGEADDEDDELEGTSGWRDSGIGTGRDEERMASVQRRRRSLMGSGALGSKS